MRGLKTLPAALSVRVPAPSASPLNFLAPGASVLNALTLRVLASNARRCFNALALRVLAFNALRCFKALALSVLAFSVLVFSANAQQPTKPSEVIDKILMQEQVEVQLVRQYSPLVETYIQFLRPDKDLGSVPDGDKYFLGRAELAKGVELEVLDRDTDVKHKVFGAWGDFFSKEFVPRGFLQMIYLDMYGFDKAHYRLQYVRREFLGEVRCLVFDVDPLPRSGKGRFVGRIWVEDQDYNIVRFKGAYGGSSLISNYFNFDSWRMNAGKNLWLPAFIYSEEGNVRDPKTQNLGLKPFRAQTRLWGYDLGNVWHEQELNRVLVEATTPVKDQTEGANDYSPVQAERSWNRQAEINVTDRLERQGLLAPYGEVDKVLETVVNNLEVTNNVDVDPEVRCRILMISTLESFTVGHTIVLSRGLVDVLPDEASLAAILAHELAHVVLGHKTDTKFAFINHVRFDEKETFRHFDFARTPEEEQAAKQKTAELLNNSPYKEKSGTAQLFLQALKNRSKEIPNLISPHLGDRVSTSWAAASAVFAAQPSDEKPEASEKPAGNTIVALPLGGRIKLDPWNDQLRMLQSKPVGTVAEAEKMPFQITPFVFYLTRAGGSLATATPGAVAAELDTEAKPQIMQEDLPGRPAPEVPRKP
jgi:peptidase M48-like protein